MTVALGVLASGRGSNFQAILDAIQKGTLDAVVKVVLSNKASALALERGQTQKIPSIFLDPKPFAESQNPREAYDGAVGQVLQEHGVEAVVLAGYMRIVTPVLIRQFPWKIFNIHPSILPSFPGLHAQRQALEWGAKVSGCSVHSEKAAPSLSGRPVPTGPPQTIAEPLEAPYVPVPESVPTGIPRYPPLGPERQTE